MILVRDDTDMMSVDHLLLDRELYQANHKLEMNIVLSRTTLYECEFARNLFDSLRIFDLDMPFLFLLPGNDTELPYILKNIETLTTQYIVDFV